MRDHVTEELISAYIDGELTDDERKLVESRLADSAEHRQLLHELQELRADLQALPSFHLSLDFSARVVTEIQDSQSSPSKEPVELAPRRSNPREWGSLLAAAATLAAVLVLTVFMRPEPTTNPITPQPVMRPVPVFLQQAPQFAVVYDVTVTPAGQKQKTFDRLLKDLGIAVDPALKLDGKLEAELMTFRDTALLQGAAEIVPYKSDKSKPRADAPDRVEMIYIAGKMGVLDQLGLRLKSLEAAGETVSRMHYDMVFEPRQLEVMRKLQGSARDHLAQSTETIISEQGHAFRLAVRLQFTSIGVPGAATLPIPRLVAQRELETPQDPATLNSPPTTAPVHPDVDRNGVVDPTDALRVLDGLNVGEVMPADLAAAAQANAFMNEPAHVLVILRNAAE